MKRREKIRIAWVALALFGIIAMLVFTILPALLVL